MALHFSGNQYEQAYKPRVLRNWEVPKKYDDKPKPRTGKTQIISNDRGHLLPGVPRSKESPWGNFVGTWHLPRRIDKETADKLNGTVKKRTCEERRRAKEQKLEEIKEETTVQEAPEEAAPKTEEKPQEPTPAEPEKVVEQAPFCPIHGYPA